MQSVYKGHTEATCTKNRLGTTVKVLTGMGGKGNKWLKERTGTIRSRNTGREASTTVPHPEW